MHDDRGARHVPRRATVGPSGPARCTVLYQVTDQVLASVGRASHALNPVRVTGRTVGVLVAGALHLGGVLTTRGGRAAQRRAREATGQR